jgi:hypothetical protein
MAPQVREAVGAQNEIGLNRALALRADKLLFDIAAQILLLK